MLKIIKRHFSIFAFIIIAAISVLTYLPSFNSSFHLDDIDRIRNSNIQNVSIIELIKKYDTRWLVFLTFQANVKIHGFDVFGYHVVNISIHIICSFLLFSFVRLLWIPLRRKYPLAFKNFSPRLTPLFIALLFAVHPLQSQAVIYISQRLALMSTMFSLLALDSVARGYLRGHSKTFGWLGAVLAILFGFFCKETIVIAPLLIITFLLFFYPPKFCEWSWKKWILISVLFLIVIALPIILLFQLADWDFKEFLIIIESVGGKIDVHTPDMTRYSYALTQSKVILKYILLFICPRGLNIDHEVQLCKSIFSMQVIFSFGVITALFIFGWIKRKTAPLFLFGLILFFLALLPQSSIIPTPDLMFEHRAYFGTAGLILAFVSVFSFIKSKIILIILSVGIIFCLAFSTFQRGEIWKSEVTLWADAYQKAPSKQRIVNNYANALINVGEIEVARKILEQFISNRKYIFPSFCGLLGNIYIQQGELEKAKYIYYEGLKNNWWDLSLRYNYAVVCRELKDFKSAVHNFRRCVQFHPDDADSRFMLGMVYSDNLTEYSKATNQFTIFLELFPNNENVNFVKKKLKRIILEPTKK